MRGEIEGKFVGLERVIVDTRYAQLLLVLLWVCCIILMPLFYRRYVDEIKELLVSMKDQK